MSTGKGKVVVNRTMSLDGYIAGPGFAGSETPDPRSRVAPRRVT